MDRLVWGPGLLLAGAVIGTLVGVIVSSRHRAPSEAFNSDVGSATRMGRMVDRLSDTTLHLRLNLWGMGIWLVLLPPTILFWRDSVPYVVFMSWYANSSATSAPI